MKTQQVVQEKVDRTLPQKKRGTMQFIDNRSLPVSYSLFKHPDQQVSSAPLKGAPIQCKLHLEDISMPSHIPSLFENMETFVKFIKISGYVNPQVGDRKAFWELPIMQKYVDWIQSDETVTVSHDEFIKDIREAEKDIERLDVLFPDRPIPVLHELVRFAEPPLPELHDHSAGPVGYATKMIGDSAQIEYFSSLLTPVQKVIITTKGEEILKSEAEHWTFCPFPKSPPVPDRRPGLSIINFCQSIYHSGNTLAICGVPGKILSDQFGLAIREFVHAILHREIEIQTIYDKVSVEKNYSRLLNFFKNNPLFCHAKTLVFGYASAFESNKERYKMELLEKKESHGWKGFLFERESILFAVFDSDNDHSYHGEILAQNINVLLKDPYGHHIEKIFIGGSAGSLVHPSPPSEESVPPSLPSEEKEESLSPNGLYIPEAILRPDGYFKENALYGDIRGDIQTLPGSMHTSVVSVLAETPSILEDLYSFGIKTVDMEFGYVALVLGEVNPHRSTERDLARVQLGVACLVTDFPRTGAEDIALAKKDAPAKKKAKELFVQMVINHIR